MAVTHNHSMVRIDHTVAGILLPGSPKITDDVMAATTRAVAQAAPADVDAARRSPPLLRFSDPMRAESTVLKRFLFANLYRHPQVLEKTSQAQEVVRELFAAYMHDPAQMRRGAVLPTNPAPQTARVVADYIAGMTDRFAAREHARLSGRSVIT